MNRFAAVLSAFGMIGGSCKERTELDVRDSEGRGFHARCEDRAGCTFVQVRGEKWPDEASGLVLRTSGRVIGICNVGEAGHVDSETDCRPLVCGVDTECPPLPGLEHGACAHGLCTDPRNAIEMGDAVMLCLFGTGLGHDKPLQVERFAMAHQCGAPCEVPSSCRQP